MKFTTGFTLGAVAATFAIMAFVAISYESKRNRLRRQWDSLAVTDRWSNEDWDEWLAGS